MRLVGRRFFGRHLRPLFLKLCRGHKPRMLNRRTRNASRASARHCRPEFGSLPAVRGEFRADQFAEPLLHGLVAEALDDFVEEAEDDEPLGILLRDAAGEEVEKLLLLDLPAGRAVGAADVVGFDLQAGRAVGFGFVAEEEVADFLVGVGAVRAGIDADAGEEFVARGVIHGLRLHVAAEVEVFDIGKARLRGLRSRHGSHHHQSQPMWRTPLHPRDAHPRQRRARHARRWGHAGGNPRRFSRP